MRFFPKGLLKAYKKRACIMQNDQNNTEQKTDFDSSENSNHINPLNQNTASQISAQQQTVETLLAAANFVHEARCQPLNNEKGIISNATPKTIEQIKSEMEDSAPKSTELQQLKRKNTKLKQAAAQLEREIAGPCACEDNPKLPTPSAPRNTPINHSDTNSSSSRRLFSFPTQSTNNTHQQQPQLSSANNTYQLPPTNNPMPIQPSQLNTNQNESANPTHTTGAVSIRLRFLIPPQNPPATNAFQGQQPSQSILPMGINYNIPTNPVSATSLQTHILNNEHPSQLINQQQYGPMELDTNTNNSSTFALENRQ